MAFRIAFVRILIYKNEAIKYFSIKVHTRTGPNMSVSINGCRGILIPAQTLYGSVVKFTVVLNCAFSIFNSMYVHTTGISDWPIIRELYCEWIQTVLLSASVHRPLKIHTQNEYLLV